MKFILFIGIVVLGSCISPTPRLKTSEDSLNVSKDNNVNVKDSIIDPIAPYAFDINTKK